MHAPIEQTIKNKPLLSTKTSSSLLANRLGIIVFLFVCTIYVTLKISPKNAMLLVLGIALGITLCWATFSFSNGWRYAITERKSIWLRAQMLMLVVASVLMLPVIAKGSLFGNNVQAFIRPVGVSLLCGAFMFGLGMQIAGSCASGSLYRFGGGRLKMFVVLAFFILGAFLASAHYTWWMEKPNYAPVAWIDKAGLTGAILINTGIAIVIAMIARYFEMKSYSSVEPLFGNVATKSIGKTLLIGAILLATLNFVTLGLAGRPWSVASAFPFWGAKASQSLGLDLDLDFWDYWSSPGMETMLNGGILESTTSIMNIGIILGALAIAIGLNRFTFTWRISLRDFVGAVLGGVLLGYGSTIAFGCNIGAFFGGVASGSLHGWIWFIAAFIGTGVGVLVRPLFTQDK